MAIKTFQNRFIFDFSISLFGENSAIWKKKNKKKCFLTGVSERLCSQPAPHSISQHIPFKEVGKLSPLCNFLETPSLTYLLITSSLFFFLFFFKHNSRPDLTRPDQTVE